MRRSVAAVLVDKEPMSLPIAFSGSRGAYSQQAARRFFGVQSPFLTCLSAAEAVRAVAEGRAASAVLAVENAITGPFAGVAEALAVEGVRVVGEVVLPVRHALLGVPGARFEDVAVVTSHPSALAQCRDWLSSLGLATRSANDTGEAAAELASSQERAAAVLGGRELAHEYGLVVLAEGLSDRPDNRTRFIVVGHSVETGASGERLVGQRSALLIGPLRAPRALKTLRMRFESLGCVRVRAPLVGSADGTRFLVEFDVRERRPMDVARTACAGVDFRFLGTWHPSGQAGWDVPPSIPTASVF